jgi:ArsR family transcriptional regulator, lead/cadmium/zinc/bismuth-responsive transcriptional repressor
MLIKMAQAKNVAISAQMCYIIQRIVAWLYRYSFENRMVCMVSHSADAVYIASPAANLNVTVSESVYKERSIHTEHVLAVRSNLLTTDTAMRIASLFAVLSDPTRLQVVYALLRAPSGELCVGDLAIGLGRDDTTISHQLRVLRNQQIVAMRKAGRMVYYRLVDEHIRLLLELGMTHTSETSLSSKEGEAGSLA